MVNWACRLTDADLEQFHYRLSDPAKEVPLMTWEDTIKATDAIMNYYEKQIYGQALKDIN